MVIINFGSVAQSGSSTWLKPKVSGVQIPPGPLVVKIDEVGYGPWNDHGELRAHGRCFNKNRQWASGSWWS